MLLPAVLAPPAPTPPGCDALEEGLEMPARLGEQHDDHQPDQEESGHLGNPMHGKSPMTHLPSTLLPPHRSHKMNK
jgi:hypothetical protein